MKRLLSLLLFALITLAVKAVPVYPHPVKVTQADGTVLTIIGHGDEYCHYLTTVDGYTIVQGDDKLYHYANLHDGQLVPTAYLAHEPHLRSFAEQAFLANCRKYIAPEASKFAQMNELMLPEQFRQSKPSMKTMMAKAKGRAPEAEEPDGAPAPYRGLVILVNYNDRKFRFKDEKAHTLFDDMLNKEGFDGYLDKNGFQACTGSVRDYFYDNSYGQFLPQFDVVGPIDIDVSQYGFQAYENTISITQTVLEAVDPLVDFSDYDNDGDGLVDYFYVIYAGYASSYSTNDERLLWPHAYNMLYSAYFTGDYVMMDNVYLGSYACSTELYGWTSMGDTDINGIGTICHEFSHVLGLADHYDVDYGNHETPGDWDVMSGGSYNGTCGRTPAGYNALERSMLGFIDAPDITESLNSCVTLRDAALYPDVFSLKMEGRDETFYFENRQPTKWDSCLPGHGMLIWRADNTHPDLWYNNQVNSTDRLCFQLVRAGGYLGHESATDPFPGEDNVTMVNPLMSNGITSPNGAVPFVSLNNITETDGLISFDVAPIDLSVDVPVGSLFYESFTQCFGKGGNDDQFSGNLAAGTFQPDNEGWTAVNISGAYQCAKLGTNRQNGVVLSPVIHINGRTELSFRAASYANECSAITLSVSSGDGTLSETSFPITDTGCWHDFKVMLTGRGDIRLRFKGTKRWFLDEVNIMPVASFGDANVDGEVTMSDANLIVNYFLGVDAPGIDLELSDCNADAVVSMSDANAVVNIYVGNGDISIEE